MLLLGEGWGSMITGEVVKVVAGFCVTGWVGP